MTDVLIRKRRDLRYRETEERHLKMEAEIRVMNL